MKDKTKIFFKKIILAIFSGLLISLTLNPKLRFISWFALVPLITALDKERFWKSLSLGLITGLIFSFFLSKWIALYDKTGFFIALIYIASFIVIISLVINYFSKNIKNKKLKILIIPLAWLGLQFLFSFNQFGSYFADIGYLHNVYLMQIISITGVAGLTFLVILANAAIAYLIISKDRFMVKFAAVILLVILALSFYGYITVPEIEGDISVAVIQPNLPQDWRWDAIYINNIIKEYRELALEASEKASIVIFPQYRLPVNIYEQPEIIGDVANETNAYVMLGTYKENYNIGVLFGPNGRIAGEYTAVHKPPFREQTIGNKYSIIKLPPMDLSIILRYDDTSGEVVRTFVNNGAQVLFNLANDGMFIKTIEPELHLTRSIVRAVENRRFIVRATANGISAVIDPYGRVLKKSEVLNKNILVENVYGVSKKTFYTRFGDIITPLAFILALFFFIRTIKFRK